MLRIDDIENIQYEVGHYENGEKFFEVSFSNGLKHGVFRLWHPNGKLASESNWVYGVLHGVSKTWHADGNIMNECVYDNGKIVQPKQK